MRVRCNTNCYQYDQYFQKDHDYEFPDDRVLTHHFTVISSDGALNPPPTQAPGPDVAPGVPKTFTEAMRQMPAAEIAAAGEPDGGIV